MWKNWSGYVECPRTPVLTPGSGAELATVLADAAHDGRPVRVVGAGHSFSPLVASDGVIVSLDRLQGILDVDAAARIARVRAGTRLVALGSLGVLTELSLRLVPAYRLRLERGRMDLEECLAQADALVAANRQFEFYWLPHTETVLTKKWNITDAPVDESGVGRWVSDVLLENIAFGLLCDVGKAVPSLCPPLSRLCASLVSASEQVDAGWSMLSTVRQVRFNEMEWSVPAARGAGALREIKALIGRREFPLMFPLEYRWVRGDDLWLSPNHGRDSVHISVHQYRGMPFEIYFDAVQSICLNHGGRPHWGKVHSLKAPQLARLYPRWDDFLALREKMDPNGLFLTPYLRALFGV